MLDAFDLGGRVALVTGGGRGLGQAIARALAAAGATVAVSSRSRDQLDETVATLDGDGHLAIPWDLSQRDRAGGLVDEVAARRERVDVLVHAGGLQVRKPALELTGEDWDLVNDVHLRSAFELSTAFARGLLRRGGGGAIVFVASLTSYIAVPNTAAYGAAKSGLTGLMRTLAVEWAPHRIRVNAVAPGFFHTAMTDDVLSDPDRRAQLEARIPLGRTGDPAELGGAVVYLASDASSYVTGQVLNVDGGWLVA